VRSQRRAALAAVLDRMTPAARADLVRALAAFDAAATSIGSRENDVGLRTA
jgi:hypothetical protein